MSRYFDFSFTVEGDILNFRTMEAHSHVWVVTLNALRRGWLGNVVADRFHIASIPKEYGLSDMGKSQAVKIGMDAVKTARRENEFR